MSIIGQPIILGGNELDFEVIGGTTRPTFKKGFGIWINTSVEITKWLVSITTPPTTFLTEEGDVWIRPGRGLDRIGTKVPGGGNNTINISPIMCHQYIGGKWLSKPFEVGNETGWYDSRKLVLYGGNNKEEVFAGIGLQLGFNLNQGTTLTSNKYIIFDDYIRWAVEATPGNSFTFEPAIDLTAYNYVCFDMLCLDRMSDKSAPTVGVGTNKMTDFAIPGAFTAEVTKTWNTKRETVRVDVSELTGEHYVKLAGYGTMGYLYNCWLE